MVYCIWHVALLLLGVCFCKHRINQFGKVLFFCGADLVANYIITQNIRIYQFSCRLIAESQVKVWQRCGSQALPWAFCINTHHISITDEIWAWAPASWLRNHSKETLKQHKAFRVPSQHTPHTNHSPVWMMQRKKCVSF